MVKVSNLTFSSALDFSASLKNYELEESEVFDFSAVRNSDPFPMLLASTAIRQLRARSTVKKCKAENCNNSYAEHMRFYKAIGINIGHELDENYGNKNYLPITKLDIKDLRNSGIQNLERIQEVIAKKSREMANVLSRGNVSFANWSSYVLTEIMRNIPEHSNANAIWYCAQYWPSYDLVELAILDEGRGIKESLLSNGAYDELVSSDEEALRLALEPGISRTFVPGSRNLSDDEWKNSGFGLYMVSRLCDRLGGSFIIASGNAALRLYNNKNTFSKCFLQGTGIQIRISPSQIHKYREVAEEILREGELSVKGSDTAFSYASKSTRSLFSFEK